MKARINVQVMAAIALSTAVGCTPQEQGESDSSPSTERQVTAVDRDNQGCGPDVMDLLASRDPEFMRMYEEAPEEFSERWLSRVRCLAADGDIHSAVTLGIVYRDGSDGPSQDHAKAAAWFQRAAVRGDPMAQFNLGQLYRHGRGVPQDMIHAYVWLTLAAAGSGEGEGELLHLMAAEGLELLESHMTAAELRTALNLARAWLSE